MRGIDQLPTNLIEAARTAITEAHEILGPMAAESTQPDLHEAAARLNDADKRLCAAYQAIAEARRFFERYLRGIGPGVGSATDSSARTTSPRSSYAAHRLSREQVAALQSDLPPPVPKPNPEGRKTHGRSVDEHGKTSQEISGRDDDSAEVWRLLKLTVHGPNYRKTFTGGKQWSR